MSGLAARPAVSEAARMREVVIVAFGGVQALDVARERVAQFR